MRNVGYMLIPLILSGCNMRIEKSRGDLTVGAGWYASIEQKILKPKCMSCHSGPMAAGDIDVSSFEALVNSKSVVPFDPEKSSFFTTLAAGTMPKGKDPLSKEDVEMVFKWIKDGAKLKADAPPPPPPVEEKPLPTFAWLNKNVFAPRCVVCHNNEKPRGLVNFSSYQALINSEGHDERPITPKNPDRSTVFVQVVEKRMPPRPRPFNEEEKKALHDWILAGALEVTPGTVLPGPEEPNPPQPNFEWLSKFALRRCASCHGIPFRVANVDFTSYATLTGSQGKSSRPLAPGEPLMSGIYTEVASGHMPPPQKVLSPEESDAVRQWILDGALNN